MTDPSKQSSGTLTAQDRRRFRRIATRIEGRIVYAGVDAECLIHEISATGAIVEVAPLPAIDTDIALDAPGVGFARGVAKRYPAEGLVSIDLATPPARRDKLTDRLILAAFRFPPLTGTQ